MHTWTLPESPGPAQTPSANVQFSQLDSGLESERQGWVTQRGPLGLELRPRWATSPWEEGSQWFSHSLSRVSTESKAWPGRGPSRHGGAGA